MKDNKYHLSYRPDIDGLRSVAVLVVIGFHAFPKLVPGGFIGVDIFFVISGYLISSIIFGGLFTDTFEFRDFYKKRIKRIAPALVIVLLSTLFVGFFVLLPDELTSLSKQILGGALFSSNFILLQDLGYFAEASDSKPLLHLWSLAIEEQFYLFWPFVLTLAWRKKLNLLTITIATLCVSFYLNLRYVNFHPEATFFLPVMRLWELLVGSVLAYFVSTRTIQFSSFLDRSDICISKLIFSDKNIRHAITQNILSTVGSALIVIGLISLNPQKSFPGTNALYPTIGSFCLIAGGTNAWINKHILANKLFVFIGLISYPLYLWHWPLLSFARIMQNEVPAIWIRIVAVAISFVLAYATYRFVERPIRLAASIKTTILLAIALLSIGLAGGYVWRNDGFEERYPNRMTYVGTYSNIEGTFNCTSDFSSLNGTFCQRVAHPSLVIIGDSHSGHFFYGFLKSENATINQPMVLGAYSCAPALGLERRKGCNEQLEKALSIIEKTDTVKTVAMASYFDYVNDSPDAEKKLFDGYVAVIKRLQNSGKKVIFMVDTPSLKFEPNTCIDDRPLRITKATLRESCGVSIEEFEKQRVTYYSFLQRLKTSTSGVYFYDSSPLFFKNGSLNAFLGNKRLFWDKNHLTIYGSMLVASDLAANMEGQH